jgi:hypothetical protein
MNPRPLTLEQKAARLHAQFPHRSHSEIMSMLAGRLRRKPVHGVLHICNSDRNQHANIESPRYAWMQRADLA